MGHSTLDTGVMSRGFLCATLQETCGEQLSQVDPRGPRGPSQFTGCPLKHKGCQAEEGNSTEQDPKCLRALTSQ